MDEPSLKELLEELNCIEIMKDSRYKILILQLYSEHYVNELLMHMIDDRFIGKEVREQISFPKKLKILERAKIIGSEISDILFILNDLRSIAVHTLVVDEKLINQKLKQRKLWFDYKINFNKDGKDITGVNLKEMYDEVGATEYAQLNVSSMLSIGILYSRLKVIKKQEIDFILFPELEKNDDGLFVNVTISERAIDQELAKKSAEETNLKQENGHSKREKKNGLEGI